MEFMIALIVAALIALVVGQVMSTSTRNVAVSVDNTVSQQAMNRLISQIRYDASGASSISVYGTSAPSATPCSSLLDPSFGTWLWTANAESPVLRPLFNIRIPTPAVDNANNWSEVSDVTAGYEIRREAGGSGRPMEIWRIQCSGGVIAKREMMIRLPQIPTGLTLPFGGGFPDGTNFLLCPGAEPKYATTPTISAGRYVFSTDSNPSVVTGNGVWFIDTSKFRGSVYGLVSSSTASSVTLSTTSNYVDARPNVDSALPSITGARFLLSQPCSASSSGLFSSNKFLILNIPYFGRLPAIRNLPPVTVKSRVSL